MATVRDKAGGTRIDPHLIPPSRSSTGASYTVGAWTAGSDTKSPVVVAAGRARCERLGLSNPRISRQVSGLSAGKTYRVDTNHYAGTAIGSAYYRTNITYDLLAGALGEFIQSGTGAISYTFVAPAGGIVFTGFVQIADTDGQYAETADTFTLTQTN